MNGNTDKRLVKWEKPTKLAVKANWDATVDAHHMKRVGVGVVIRDSKGEMLACLCSKFDHNKNPIVAEALALRRDAILCAELGLSDVMLEGDSQLTFNATSSGEEIWAEYENIIEDIKKVMPERSNWCIKFVYREATNIAHKLAKLALTFYDEKEWIEEGPVEITNDMLKEKYCND
ncbi:hypothetical protein F2P56_009180 [Juglans regia]|uniref:RNase H type-1 domain-containing protein n=2 Tax=Juglans regia TaxID=51240 RepID=A0A833XT70_JUGRE|nr:uncharacterized protein LOC108990213 [Juglans regia]KAF5472463.1 hypothetical protein F2P56_009180 [Juglans regia]